VLLKGGMGPPCVSSPRQAASGGLRKRIDRPYASTERKLHHLPMTGAASRPSSADQRWRLERWLCAHYVWIAVAVITWELLTALARGGWDAREGIWIREAGIVGGVVLLGVALTLPDRVDYVLRRLIARGSLSADDAAHDEFTRRTNTRARRAALIGAIGGGVFMATGWILARAGWSVPLASTLLINIVLGALFGLFIGRALVYGRLGGLLRRSHIAVVVKPRHPDSAGGLRLVGDLYWFQASILAVVAAYFGVFWLLAPLVGRQQWRTPFAVVVLVIVICEVLILVVPMWSFHKILRKYREDQLLRADEIGVQLDDLDRQFTVHPAKPVPALQEQISNLTAQYAAIEALPTWPIPVGVRRRFAIRNVILLLPALAQLVGASTAWQDLLDRLGKV
jgi:hypothetical protein